MIYDLIIIGSGPAGYAAAIYAARGGADPLLLAGPEPGGQLTTTTDVENFPGFPEGIKGPQLMENMKKQAERFGTTVKYEVATKVDFSTSPKTIWANETKYQARAVIISTGARSRTLNLEREKDLWGRGVHTCATCDGFFYRDKIVTVVGGGDSAMEESNFLTKFAKKVYIVHRGEEFKASQIMQDRIFKNPKIEIIKNSQVVAYLGEQKLNGLKIKNSKTEEETELTTDAIFFAIGHIPNTDIFKGQINILDNGYIDAKENIQTNVAGVFAAGDCVDHIYRQAVTAAGLGAMAAIAAERWLEKNEQ